MQEIFENINNFLTAPFIAIVALVFKFLHTSIINYKNNLDSQFADLKQKIGDLEEKIEKNNSYLVDKILSIAPNTISLENKVIKLNDRIHLTEVAIGALSKKYGALTKDVGSDLENFKKILFKLREELNNLHGGKN